VSSLKLNLQTRASLNQNSTADIVTRLLLVQLRNCTFPVGARDFFSSKVQGSGTQPAFLVVKQQGHEADQTPLPSSAEVKKEWASFKHLNLEDC
jgi:hypothetical protein